MQIHLIPHSWRASLMRAPGVSVSAPPLQKARGDGVGLSGPRGDFLIHKQKSQAKPSAWLFRGINPEDYSMISFSVLTPSLVSIRTK